MFASDSSLLKLLKLSSHESNVQPLCREAYRVFLLMFPSKSERTRQTTICLLPSEGSSGSSLVIRGARTVTKQKIARNTLHTCHGACVSLHLNLLTFISRLSTPAVPRRKKIYTAIGQVSYDYSSHSLSPFTVDIIIKHIIVPSSLKQFRNEREQIRNDFT